MAGIFTKENIVAVYGIFRNKYKVIDDIVQYCSRHRVLGEIDDNVEAYPSGFTVAIGKLVNRLLFQYRTNELFQAKMLKVVNECIRLNENSSARSVALEKAVQFVPMLETNIPFYYFVYFAVTAELCYRFEEANCDNFVTEVKDAAKATLYVYWENGLRCEELDDYAKRFLEEAETGEPRNYCSPEYFGIVQRFLTRDA